MNRWVAGMVVAVLGCAGSEAPVGDPAAQVVALLEQHPGQPLLPLNEAVDVVVRPEGFEVSTEPLPPSGGFWLVEAPMTLRLPRLASGAASLRDRKHGVSVQWRLEGARDAVGERAGAVVVYRGALEGADLTLRPGRQGVEDYLTFPRAPREERVTYEVSLGDGVAGLRVVEGVVELLDADGAPRIRIGRAQVVDASGRRHDATLSLQGCEADNSLAPPWGRPVTPPGAQVCRVSYRWQSEGSGFYPAVFDPPFTLTAGAMSSGRMGHRAVEIPVASGQTLTLVCGGFNSVLPDVVSGGFTPATASCDFFNVRTRSWAAAPSMLAPRTNYTLAYYDGGVLAAGGRALIENGPALQTSELLRVFPDGGAGPWIDAGLTSIERGLAVSVVLPNGVLVCGGQTLTTRSTTCDQFVNAPSTWFSVNSYTATGFTPGAAGHTMSYDPTRNLVVIYGGAPSSGVGGIVVYEPGIGVRSESAFSVDLRQFHVAGFDPVSQRHFVVGGTNSAFNTAISRQTQLISLAAGTPTITRVAGTDAPFETGFTEAVRLTDGGFLVAGGGRVCCRAPTGLNDASNGAGVLTVANGGWASVGPINTARASHTSTMTDLGLVLLAGGMSQTSTALNTSELYGLLDNGTPCDQGARCVSEFCVADTNNTNRCCATNCPQACAACATTGAGCVARPNGATPRVSCGNFRCDGTNLNCPTTCSGNSGCVAGTECRGGQCLPPAPDGGTGGGGAGGGAAGGSGGGGAGGAGGGIVAGGGAAGGSAGGVGGGAAGGSAGGGVAGGSAGGVAGGSAGGDAGGAAGGSSGGTAGGTAGGSSGGTSGGSAGGTSGGAAGGTVDGGLRPDGGIACVSATDCTMDRVCIEGTCQAPRRHGGFACQGCQSVDLLSAALAGLLLRRRRKG